MGPRVATVMASRLLVLAAVRISGCAVCERGISAFLAAVVVGIVALFGCMEPALRAWVLVRRCFGVHRSAERSGDLALS
jgi:hypothetical protein